MTRLVKSVDPSRGRVHHCSFGTEGLVVSDHLLGSVGQEPRRQTDEVGTTQTCHVERRAEHFRTEFVAMPVALTEAHGVQMPDRGAMGVIRLSSE